MKMTKAERARNLRYKKAALASMGYESIVSELLEIQDACGDIRYFTERDSDTLVNALDGDEDDAFEFKMMFSDLDEKCELLLSAMYEMCIQEDYDDCTVALIGNRYDTVGWDDYQEDYYSLCSYDSGLAHSEAGKRLMRKTKAEIISSVGQCVGILIAFLDIRQRYDYLKATFDILRDENTSHLQIVKEIEKAYNEAVENGYSKDFDSLVASMPDRSWIE